MFFTNSGIFLLFMTMLYCYGARINPKQIKEDPRLAQKTMELKKQGLKIMALQGHKIGKTKVAKGATWGDIQMNWRLYKNLKSKMDKELKRLESVGGGANKKRGGGKEKMFSRITAPDFSLIPYSKWTESDMPIKYTLFNVYDQNLKSEIRRALREIESQVGGCISFQEVGSYPYGPFIDYVERRGLSICGQSPLGKDPQMNRIIIDSGCKHYATALHETLHSLGFAHTQQRPDADQYLWINWDNIQPGAKNNFVPWGYALRNQGRFDYGSIMMYPRNAFAIDRSQDTMTPRYNARVNGKLMGQRDGLSDEDANILRQIYRCSGNPGSRRNNGGGGGTGRRNNGFVTTRAPPPQPGRRIRIEEYYIQKVSSRRCARPKTDQFKCQGLRICDNSGTYEASCNRGYYFQLYKGQYVCMNDRRNC